MGLVFVFRPKLKVKHSHRGRCFGSQLRRTPVRQLGERVAQAFAKQLRKCGNVDGASRASAIGGFERVEVVELAPCKVIEKSGLAKLGNGQALQPCKQYDHGNGARRAAVAIVERMNPS